MRNKKTMFTAESYNLGCLEVNVYDGWLAMITISDGVDTESHPVSIRSEFDLDTLNDFLTRLPNLATDECAYLRFAVKSGKESDTSASLMCIRLHDNTDRFAFAFCGTEPDPKPTDVVVAVISEDDIISALIEYGYMLPFPKEA